MAISWDSPTEVSGSTASGPLNLNHDCLGNDRLLAVGIGLGDATPGTITGITANGRALTKLADAQQVNVRAELWILVGPDAGTNSIAIALSEEINNIHAWAACGTPVDSTTPNRTPSGASGASLQASVTVTSDPADDVLAAVVRRWASGLTLTAGSGVTDLVGEQVDGDAAPDIESHGGRRAGSSPNQTITYDLSDSNRWAIVAASFVEHPNPTQSITGADSITSSEAFGSGGSVNLTISGSDSIPSAEAFGSGGTVSHGAQIITGTDSIPSAEAFGSGVVAGPITGVDSIPSGEVFGSAGVVSIEAELTLSVMIDWDDDGDFGDPNEDVSDNVYEVTVSAGRSRATGDFGPGTAAFLLDNYSGLYNGFASSGALAGKIVPGREVVIEAVYDSVTYPLFRGRISDIGQARQMRDRPVIPVSCVDGFEELRRGEIRLPIQEGKRVDEIITAILDAANWPAGRRSLAEAAHRLDFFWSFRESPLEALRTATRQEIMGNLYIDRSGNVAFEGRHSRFDPPVYATLTDVDMLDLELTNTDLVDSIEIIRSGLKADTLQTPIFELSTGDQAEGYRLRPGSNTIEGEFESGAREVQDLVAGLDYVANSAPDGGGFDRTADVSVESLTKYGKGFKAVLGNARTSDIYLTTFQVRGRLIQSSNDERRTITAPVSSPLVTNQPLVREYEFLDDEAALSVWAEMLATYHGQRQIRPTVRPLAHTPVEIATVLGGTISKRVQVQNTTGLWPTELSFDGFLEAYSLTFRPNEDIEAQWTLLPPERPDFGPDNPFIIGTSQIGGSDVLAF